ncbi:uncharacterized protein LOC106011415 [Aplysia californica]|uniref:Uncharacterized protein LOC106011415 n=1 Tax=Aplysia californica TaxID=6500 RepID=A0ABM0ZXB8_APLCA|nr:uncharacterized protein LOC106011415 [Aplysia californica]
MAAARSVTAVLLCFLTDLLLGLLISSSTGATNIKTFYQVTSSSQNGVQLTGRQLTRRSVLECANLCLSPLNSPCSGFAFVKTSSLCKLGEMDYGSPVTHPLDHSVYGASIVCDASSGFEVRTHGSAAACLWISTTALSFENAENTCVGFGGHLMTTRSPDKFSILQEIVKDLNENTWFGLSTSAFPDFRWVDDLSKPTQNISEYIFDTNQPDFDWDHCVEMFPWSLKANNYNCSVPRKFVCERK